MAFFILFIVVIITFIVQANIFLLCFLHYEKTEYTFQKFIQTINLEFESLKQLRTNFPEIEPEERKSIRNKLLNYGMSIQEISNIHKRSPEAIRLRLVKHNLIKELNFLKTELVDLEKTKISDGIRENGIVLLTEILSNHISKINERLERIESKVNSLVNLDELD